MEPSTSSFALAFHRAARVTRANLYGTSDDRQLPRNLHADARVPFLGFCGHHYTAGGSVLLAINPGGGGDAYVARTPQDRELLPLIERFIASPSEDVHVPFERMCASYAAQAQTWNLWRILKPAIDACGHSPSEICYLNLFPYRTAKDALPSAQALRQAWQGVVAPLLAELRPSLLVALGKKAGNVAARFHTQPPPLFIVPRTIGDSRVSPEAHEVLTAIRNRAT